MATVVGTYHNLEVDFFHEKDVALLSIEFYIREAIWRDWAIQNFWDIWSLKLKLRFCYWLDCGLKDKLLYLYPSISVCFEIIWSMIHPRIGVGRLFKAKNGMKSLL